MYIIRALPAKMAVNFFLFVNFFGFSAATHRISIKNCFYRNWVRWAFRINNQWRIQAWDISIFSIIKKTKRKFSDSKKQILFPRSNTKKNLLKCKSHGQRINELITKCKWKPTKQTEPGCIQQKVKLNSSKRNCRCVKKKL